jgi:hypothetical protein
MKTSGGQATGKLFMVQGFFNVFIVSYYALIYLFHNFVSGCENFWWPGDGEAVHGAGVLMCLLFMLCFD